MECSQCRVHVYCNAKCQRAHYFEHKKACKMKSLDKIMYRAGALLQMLYFAFRRITFRHQFSKIGDSGRHLTIHAKPFAISGVTFSPFPDSLVPSEKEKNMVLCASRCGNFVGHFKEVIEMILKGNLRSQQLFSLLGCAPRIMRMIQSVKNMWVQSRVVEARLAVLAVRRDIDPL
jgi:hypothetical protein